MIGPGVERPIDIAELERAVRATDPAAWLVPPRILRRVVRHDLGSAFLDLQISHRRAYVIHGDALGAIVSLEELGLGPDAVWPESAILLPRPGAADLAGMPRGLVLSDYWRLLFHARTSIALDRKLSDGTISAEDISRRIEEIGPGAFEEVRAVLGQEDAVSASAEDRAVYASFGAYFLGLRRFAPSLLPHTFPAIDDPEAVERLLENDVDVECLLASTRIEGADDPRIDRLMELVAEDDAPDRDAERSRAEPPASGAARRWLHRAAAAGARGNLVRAAILRTQAARRADPDLAGSIDLGARDEIDRLARRLQRALELDDLEAERWQKALLPLLRRSAQGYWTAEARLLYDLQKVCVDHEREVFTIDLVEWVATLGRRPLRRMQPHLRAVMSANHLRGAARRLPSVRIGSEERARLAEVLRPAVARSEAELRDRLRGPIDSTLFATGTIPRNLPERVAYAKLIEELLDRIVARGFLSLGDLRDAFSRSALKLPDIAGAAEFLKGDRLLRADRALSHSLDGVHRRGEIYLRGLQRLSALAFATPSGRVLTLFLALPYGGAYIVLKGLQHLVEPVAHRLGYGEVELMNPVSLLVLGTLALGLIDFPRFRTWFLKAAGALGRLLHRLTFAWLGRVIRHPLFRLVFAGQLARGLWRFALKPGLVTVPIWALTWSIGLEGRTAWTIAGVVFVESMVAVNSRLGRHIEEVLADEAVRAWQQFHRDFVPGLFRLILASFDRVLETVDRLLYTVDEWLRFRTGQGRGSIAVKAVLGAIWFFVAYLVRIYVNLLIEPQVNPIKHFPVVTVSHKIMFPFSLMLTRLIAAPLMPLGKVVANFVAVTTVMLLPGVFGFLVWEFKENWRLYEANRDEDLGRVVVGDHGETIGRLLRPGFHSGTLPKAFARLRRSERRWLRDGREKAVLKRLESLHHVEDAIRRFVDREFLALARESRSLAAVGIEAGELDLATNRIRIAFLKRDDDSPALQISLVERSGRLIAELTESGWVGSLPDNQLRALSNALAGLYKRSGVEWALLPAPDQGASSNGDGVLSSTRLASIERISISWDRWVEAWEDDLRGEVPIPQLSGDVNVLPRTPREEGRLGRTSRT